MPEASPRGRLPFLTKIFYGSGTITFGIKDQGFSALLMLYYNQVIGLPVIWVGGALMVAMIVDALFAPLLGQFSDDLRSRWGRRHPFMYAAAVPIALAYFALWMPPHLSQPALFIYLLVVATIVLGSISLYEIPSTALLAEFTNDYDERTSLVSYRFFFGVVGGVVMNVVTFKFLLRPDAGHSVGHLNPAGYATYAAVAALVMFASVVISSVGTHRQIARLQPPPATQRVSLGRTVRDMGAVLLHPTYAAILLATLFFAMTAGLNSTLNVYFTTYFWGLSAAQIATVTTSALVGIVLAFIVALPLSARFGKKHMAMALFGLSLVAGSTPLLLRLLGLFPANGDPMLVPILMAQLTFTVMCISAGTVLAVSMVADVSEQIQLTTGRRAEGLMFSIAAMVNKGVSGLGVFVSGLVLTAVNFPANAKPGAVDGAVLSHLAWIFILSTGGLSILAILCLAFYPVTRARHVESVRLLGERSA